MQRSSGGKRDPGRNADHDKCPQHSGEGVEDSPSDGPHGFWWNPKDDVVILDPERWENLHLRLLDIWSRLESGLVNADEIRSLAGLSCWASKVILFGMLYTRELYGVLNVLGMTSVRSYVNFAAAALLLCCCCVVLLLL